MPVVDKISLTPSVMELLAAMRDVRERAEELIKHLCELDDKYRKYNEASERFNKAHASCREA